MRLKIVSAISLAGVVAIVATIRLASHQPAPVVQDARCEHAFSFNVHFLQTSPKEFAQLGMSFDSSYDGSVEVKPVAVSLDELLLQVNWEKGGVVYALQSPQGTRFYSAERQNNPELFKDLWMTGAMQPIFTTAQWSKGRSADAQSPYEKIESAEWKGATDSNHYLEKIGGREKGKAGKSNQSIPFERVFTAQRSALHKLGGCEFASVQAAMTQGDLKAISMKELFQAIAEVPAKPVMKSTPEERRKWISDFVKGDSAKSPSEIGRLTGLVQDHVELVPDIQSEVSQRSRSKETNEVALSLIGVLAGSQTLAAQKALVNLLSELDPQSDYVLRVVHSTQTLNNPIPEVFKQVEALSSQSPRTETREAALLAMGTLLGRLEREDHVAYLEQWTQAAGRDDQQAALYVSTLANTRTPKAKSVLEKLAKAHPSKLIRKHARDELQSFQQSAF